MRSQTKFVSSTAISDGGTTDKSVVLSAVHALGLSLDSTNPVPSNVQDPVA